MMHPPPRQANNWQEGLLLLSFGAPTIRHPRALDVKGVNGCSWPLSQTRGLNADREFCPLYGLRLMTRHQPQPHPYVT